MGKNATRGSFECEGLWGVQSQFEETMCFYVVLTFFGPLKANFSEEVLTRPPPTIPRPLLRNLSEQRLIPERSATKLT